MVRTVSTTETHTDAEQNVLFKLTPTQHTYGYLLCNTDPPGGRGFTKHIVSRGSLSILSYTKCKKKTQKRVGGTRACQ